jgi:hypothetical protein
MFQWPAASSLISKPRPDHTVTPAPSQNPVDDRIAGVQKASPILLRNLLLSKRPNQQSRPSVLVMVHGKTRSLNRSLARRKSQPFIGSHNRKTKTKSRAELVSRTHKPRPSQCSSRTKKKERHHQEKRHRHETLIQKYLVSGQ